MGYTKRKISSINFIIPAGCVQLRRLGALLCLVRVAARLPRRQHCRLRNLRRSSALLLAFPILWARFPDKHPVNHELARYGDVREISERLDIEMSRQVEVLGPFRFTATFLVYDSGHEFQIVPYDQIVAAHVDKGSSDDAPAVVVRTRKGRQYQWYRAWLQGIFDPQKTLEKIRAAAQRDEAPPTAP
jgi:hypothetical protein